MTASIIMNNSGCKKVDCLWRPSAGRKGGCQARYLIYWAALSLIGKHYHMPSRPHGTCSITNAHKKRKRHRPRCQWERQRDTWRQYAWTVPEHVNCPSNVTNVRSKASIIPKRSHVFPMLFLGVHDAIDDQRRGSEVAGQWGCTKSCWRGGLGGREAGLVETAEKAEFDADALVQFDLNDPDWSTFNAFDGVQIGAVGLSFLIGRPGFEQALFGHEEPNLVNNCAIVM